MKRWLLRVLVVAAVVGVGAAMVIAVPRLPERGTTVPTARVARGPLSLTIHANGELRASSRRPWAACFESSRWSRQVPR
jgi:hypothetical protein